MKSFRGSSSDGYPAVKALRRLTKTQQPISSLGDYKGWRPSKPHLLACVLLIVALTNPHPATAWGDEGHKVIALIAEHYLDPTVRTRVATLLAADTDTLPGHDIANEATWADKYRDSDRNTSKIRYEATWRYHFVDIELAAPDLASACFGHPPLPAGVPASQGPPRACVVGKIDQFAAEPRDRRARAALGAQVPFCTSSGTCTNRSTQPMTTMPVGTRSSSRSRRAEPEDFCTYRAPASVREIRSAH